MEKYLVIRMKFCHLRQHGCTWKVLSEISQTEKDKCYIISHMWI